MHQSVTSQNARASPPRSLVSPELGVAVRIALDRNELLHAGGAAFVQRGAPRAVAAGNPAVVAAAVNVRHGVSAALDVRAAQEGTTIGADLVHTSEDQVGLSVKNQQQATLNSILSKHMNTPRPISQKKGGVWVQH